MSNGTTGHTGQGYKTISGTTGVKDEQNTTHIGSGHTVFAMSQNLGTTFLVRVPFAIITCLAVNAPMFVVGLCYPVSSLVSLTLCLIFYFSKKWVKMKSLEGERT